MPARRAQFMTGLHRLATRALACALILFLSPFVNASAQTLTRKTEPLPDRHAAQPAFFQMSPDKTPSGFKVPRYVSLKVGKANGRIGPSLNHPVAWQYRRRGLPLIVVAETERWRKVRDIDGDESWIYAPALSGERHAIALSDTALHSRAALDSRIKAVAATGALLKIEDCVSTQWCKFKSSDGLSGWAQPDTLWGAGTLN